MTQLAGEPNIQLYYIVGAGDSARARGLSLLQSDAGKYDDAEARRHACDFM